MPDFAKALGAGKAASTLLVLFIPGTDRGDHPIDQAFWVTEALNVPGTLFGGASAFPQEKGIWRDDENGGRLLFDEPVIVQRYASEAMIEKRSSSCEIFSSGQVRKPGKGPLGW